VEFPPFQTISKGAVYDLRLYEAYPVVEMDYRRRENGYLTLGQYQDGANTARAAFSLTQPVVMTYHPDVSDRGRGRAAQGSCGSLRLAAFPVVSLHCSTLCPILSTNPHPDPQPTQSPTGPKRAANKCR